MKTTLATAYNNSQNIPDFKGGHQMHAKIADKFAKMGNIGEGASIAADFLGKAVVVPAVIMAASKEPAEKKEYSAFKNPLVQ